MLCCTSLQFISRFCCIQFILCWEHSACTYSSTYCKLWAAFVLRHRVNKRSSPPYCAALTHSTCPERRPCDTLHPKFRKKKRLTLTIKKNYTVRTYTPPPPSPLRLPSHTREMRTYNSIKRARGKFAAFLFREKKKKTDRLLFTLLLLLPSFFLKCDNPGSKVEAWSHRKERLGY